MSGKSAVSTDISPNNNAAKNVEGVLDFNALQYECFPDLSVCVDRTYKNSFFQKNTYEENQTGYCILNSGADYINSRTSYLVFDVARKATAGAGNTSSWGKHDSAMNFIKNIRITDRAGNEIEYITDINMIHAACWALKSSTNHSTTIGTLSRPALAATEPIPVNSQVKTRYVILLRDLCGLFNFDQLLPPQLCSGLRIQIKWEDHKRVYTLPNAEGDEKDQYVISDPRIVLDSHKLTDSVARQLNLRSANDGLEIQFRTWFTSPFTTTNSNTVNVESRRAVSRAFVGLCHMREKPDTGADPLAEEKTFSMCTEAMDTTKWQWRAGNLYFPQQPVEAPTGLLNSRETLLHCYSTFTKTETPLDYPRINEDDFTSTAGNGLVEQQDGYKGGGMSIIPVNLERSSVQDVSGLPLNNSRVLAFNASVFTAHPTREIKIFLQYLKIARVFMDNTELEE